MSGIIMGKQGFDILCCPLCKGELAFSEDIGSDASPVTAAACPLCKKRYEYTDGAYDFLGEKGLEYSSSREKVIRTLYAKMYTPVTNFMFLFCGGVKSARNEVMSCLNLKSGSSVLETGMGTGDNFLWMSGHCNGLRFTGIDIQKKMIETCRKNLKKWNIQADLYHADAEELPFRDNSFDVVFHLGAINLFSNKKKAIEEMIRVARPGTHLVIADETEKAGRLFRIFTGSNERNEPPVEFIPHTMTKLKLRTIWRGYGYLVEFDKPASQHIRTASGSEFSFQ